MLLSSSISLYLLLPPRLYSVHFCIEAFQGGIADNATRRGRNEMLGVGCLPHQLSDAVNDVATPVFDRALVNVIPYQILESV
jgi:hypothetical protein